MFIFPLTPQRVCFSAVLLGRFCVGLLSEQPAAYTADMRQNALGYPIPQQPPRAEPQMTRD